MAAETVLILGGGGREHALAFKLSQTESKSQTRKVWVCPGNAGIALSFECIAPEGEGIEGLVALAKRLKPDLVIVGPEEPLAHGIVDALEREGLCVFGPSKACAQLEASKSFMKEICALAKVATARSQTFSDLASLEIYLSDKPGRHVVKADGLCAGKGVTLCENAHQTLQVAQNYLGAHGAPRFGESSQKIIVEEFLSGKEVSVIGICDGDNAMLFAPVRDHKRLLDGDLGPNTGGMGVVGPITMADDNNQFLARVRREIFLPTLKAMKDRGTPYRGFLYAGLMVEGDAINLLEFNVRLGDPEAQALLFGMSSDLYPICLSVAKKRSLSTISNVSFDMTPTAVIVMASQGYPESPKHPDLIEGTDAMPSGTQVFFAGVKKDDQGRLVTAGGRVLTCVASGETLALALKNCYEGVQQISFHGAQFRKDIGLSAL